MSSLAYFNGCMDAQDFPSAAACILADPISLLLQRPSIERLYRIAYERANMTRCDVLMIEIIGDVMATRAQR